MATMKERIKGALAVPKEKALEVSDQMDAQTQMRYIQKVADDEGWTFEEAIRKCCGSDEEKDPKYSMGYKMASPAMLIFIKSKKSNSDYFKEHYLNDKERAIYEAEVENMNLRDMWKKEERKQKKGKKKLA